jgi:hypothetical protein
MRKHRRPRRQVRGAWIVLLSPVMRYSIAREAYVLRGVGRRFGPVLTRRPPPEALAAGATAALPDPDSGTG